MSEMNYTLLCDFYELTMANGYFELGTLDESDVTGKVAPAVVDELSGSEEGAEVLERQIHILVGASLRKLEPGRG